MALAVLLAACAPQDLDVGASEPALRVPGRWQPPADVIAIANMQRVPVVDPPPVYPDGSCSGPDPLRDWCTHPACITAHPGTADIAAWIMREFQSADPADRITNLGVAGCRRNTNNPAYLSVHAIGRAIDIGVNLSSGDANNSAGDRLANFLIQHAEHIGIQRVGWDGRWFNGERGFGANMCSSRCGDSDYPSGCWPCNPHVDHLHIEVSVDAAARRTRFFTEGPPGETCPVVCYGNAAVAADCSYVNCEDSGQVCRPDPVRCVPDEAPMASHHPGAPRPTLEPMGSPARFAFVGPARVFDTRNDDTRLARSGDGIMTPDERGRVTSWPSLPAGPLGVWLNVVAADAAGPGHVQVYPSGPTAPSTSTLNYLAGSVRSNAAPTLFGEGGGVDFVPRVAGTHLIADVVGAFADTGLTLRSVAPTRVVDTRSRGDEIPAMTPFPIRMSLPAGVDARGVVASVAVINDAPGYLRVWDCGAMPDASAINYEGRGVVANTVVSRLSSEGDVCVWALNPVHVIFDVTGYFVPESDGELSYQAVRPARLLDTRQPDALYRGRLGERQVAQIPIQSLAGAPAGMRSVVVNLTTAEQDGPGYLTIWPCGAEAPIASALNYDPERGAVGTIALSSLGGGDLCVRALTRTHLIVDMVGAWVPTPGAPDPTPPEPPVDPDPEVPGEPGPDAGVPSEDASPGGPVDAASPDPRSDAGPPPGRDAGTGGELDTGCSCRAGGRSSDAGLPLAALALLGMAWRTRRARA